MIPQHQGAPYRKQRFVELENVAGEEIPAFAACEITDAYRPEKTGGITPSGGRTVLKVTKPTEDGAKACIINGPRAIPTGGKGYPGTMHDPMYAKVDSEYSAGDEIGLTSGSYELTDAAAGFIALGDFESGVMRVMRSGVSEPAEKLVELCAQEDAERNVPYLCLKGTGDKEKLRYCYGEEEVYAIDHRMGAPFAEEGWKGLYQRMPADFLHGEVQIDEIWVCVSLDCELPPEGCSCVDEES